MKVFTVEEMKNLEEYTMEKDQSTSLHLMEIAGNEAFNCILKQMDINNKRDSIIIFAGTGNNGGDGLVVARKFLQQGFTVNTMIVGKTSRMSLNTKKNLKILTKMTKNIYYIAQNGQEQFKDMLHQSTIIIDSIFGVGLNREINDIYYNIIKEINSSKGFVISIDIPSGIKGNNGKVLGIAVKADLTVIIQNYKLGNLLNDAQDYHGKMHIVDIGLDQGNIPSNNRLLQRKEIFHLIPKRKSNTHKYQYGSILTIGGSSGMTGAPLMCAYSSLRSGAGLSMIGINEKYVAEINNIYPEIMIKPYKNINDLMEIILRKNAIAFGPGLGRKDYNHNILEYLIDIDIPLIIDADGIYYLKYLLDKVKPTNHIIITPHYGEMATLLDITSKEVGKDPVYYVNKLCQEYGLIVVLKGPCTIISTKEKMIFSILGNPGMATAGSGDILTGIITSLIGQGLQLEEACTLGIYLHSRAGSQAADQIGDICMIATDIIQYLPHAYKGLSEGSRK